MAGEEGQAQILDVETALKQLEGMIRAVSDTNDKRYQVLITVIEDLQRRIDSLEKGLLSLQAEALAKASAEIVKAMCGGERK